MLQTKIASGFSSLGDTTCFQYLLHGLDLDGDDTTIRGDLTEIAFGVVLVDEYHIISHVHNFTNNLPKFDLYDLVGGDNKLHSSR